MNIELKMPAMSPTMESGTLARWLVAKGDAVRPGDLIAEIETDKATMELEAVDEGWIDTLVVPAGTDDVPVGAVIATLNTSAPAGIENAAEQVAAAEPSPQASSAVDVIPPGGGETGQAQPSMDAAPDETVGVVRDVAAPANASALALRIGMARGVDVHAAAVDGRRMMLRDLLPDGIEATASSPTDQQPAARVTDAARSLAADRPPSMPITAMVEVEVDRALDLAARLDEAIAARGVSISIEHLIIKSLAMAMSGDPSFADREAVGKESGSGTIIDIMDSSRTHDRAGSIVRGAERRALSAIAGSLAEDGGASAETARGVGLGLKRAVLSIATLDHTIPAPGALVTLTIGGVRRSAREIGGEVKFVSILRAVATVDGLEISSAAAIRLLETFKALLENPLDLTV